MANISDFARRLEAVRAAYRKLPTEIAAIAVRFSKERFVKQAWTDQNKEPWEPRKRKRGKGRSRRSQTLLVDTGRLKRSVRKIRADENAVVIGTDVPYAQIHNEGGKIKKTVGVKTHTVKEHFRRQRGKKVRVKSHNVNAHQRKMNTTIPRRQFIGNSRVLTKRITSLITSRIIQALRS